MVSVVFFATFAVRPDSEYSYVSRFSGSSAFILVVNVFCARRFVFNWDFPLGFGIDEASDNTSPSSDGRFFCFRAGFLRFVVFTVVSKLDGITAGSLLSAGFMSSDLTIVGDRMDGNVWSALSRHRNGHTRTFNYGYNTRRIRLPHSVSGGGETKHRFQSRLLPTAAFKNRIFRNRTKIKKRKKMSDVIRRMYEDCSKSSRITVLKNR